MNDIPSMMQIMPDGTFQPIQPTWTKREIYALHAMHGYCANQEFSNNMADILEAIGLARGSKENASGVRKAIAQAAFGVADAMIVASKS